MFSIIELSIRRSVFPWMLMAGFIVFGAYSFTQLGVSRMPDVDFPVVNVQLSMTGASPEVMETNIVDIVEDSLLTVEGVKEITSTSGYGMANITVELELSRNVDTAMQEITTRVSQAQKLLPTTLDPPVVSRFNPEDQPVMFIAVSAEGVNLRDQMVYVRDHLKTEFSVVPGVGQIVLGGWVDRNLRIWLNNRKLASRELTVDDILATISREHGETPAGLLETDSMQWNVRAKGEVSTSENFAGLPILYRGGQPVFDALIRIRDVGRVEDGLNDIRRISRFNGRQSVGIGIIKQRGTNAIEVGDAVKEKMKQIEANLPPGYHLNIAFDSTSFIKESIADLEITLFLSAVLTSFVCFLFLGNWSSTINILLAIPTSVFGTFIVLYIFGFTLNTFTLLGLSLAIGIVVDDAIMVLENIVRHREMGESLVTGALKGAQEISFAAVATTLSIGAIFIPVLFMSGIIGKYFFQFGVTITVAVVISLIEALTIAPMRCSRFLSIERNRFTRYVDVKFDALSNWYRNLLDWCLNHNWLVVGVSLLFFAGSTGFMFLIKKEFVPAQDQSQLLVRVQTPVGSSLNYTDGVAKQCEDILKNQPETLKYFTAVGGFGGDQSNLANIFITLKDKDDRPVDRKSGHQLSQKEVAVNFRRDLGKIGKGIKVTVQDLSMRGFSASRGFPVEVTVKGGNWDELIRSSGLIMDKMKQTGHFLDVDTSLLAGQDEIQIYPDRKRAATYGVSVAAIGKVIGAMIGGVKAGQFTDGGHRYDIRVRVEDDERSTIADIRRLYVRNNRGELVSMANVTSIEKNPGLQSITRLNRERSVTIFANPAEKTGQAQAIEEALVIARGTLPAGYSAESSGSAKTANDSFSSLGMALFLGIVVAYMILGVQFNSFLHPVTVLIALPFSFSGAIIGLWMFGQSLNIYSFIALLLLMGLVKKNSILLVDFTNHMRSGGMGVREALLTACPVRLRPILMTSAATIAAAIPPALAIGPGGETRIPMAIAVIGGTLVSTVLTLVVVPSVYSILKRFEKMPPGKDLILHGQGY